LIDPTILDYNDRAPFAIGFFGFKEYWLVINQAKSFQGTTVLIYDYLRDSWTRDKYGDLTALLETIVGDNKTVGFDSNGYPPAYPTILAANAKNFFMLDERMDGDRYTLPTTGGILAYVDTPDLLYNPTGLLNGTLERTVVNLDSINQQPNPKFHVSVSVTRGALYEETRTVQPDQTSQNGFEFQDWNLTSNVRRYRLSIITDDKAQKFNWHSISEVYVPAGERFPPDKPEVPTPSPIPGEARILVD
jgi:hypothetical protein